MYGGRSGRIKKVMTIKNMIINTAISVAIGVWLGYILKSAETGFIIGIVSFYAYRLEDKINELKNK